MSDPRFDSQFQYVPQHEREPEPALPADNVIDPFAPEHPINSAPFVRYCRNCGERIDPGASVCVHCNYVMDPVALQRAQYAARVQYEQAKRAARRNRGLIGAVSDVLSLVLVGESCTARNERAADQARLRKEARKGYLFHTVGKCYCSGCGSPIDEGAAVCVRCGYVANPLVVQQAQMMVADRNAKLHVSDVLKSLLIPGHGKAVYRTYALRRPTIAKTCRILGWVNRLLTIGAIAAVLWLIAR